MGLMEKCQIWGPQYFECEKFSYNWLYYSNIAVYLLQYEISYDIQNGQLRITVQSRFSDTFGL